MPGIQLLPDEAREQFQEVMQLWGKFYDECRGCHDLYEKLGLSALDKMENKILELGRKRKKISSLRDIYNLWIDCNEEAYHGCMADKNYLDLYGQLLNTLIDMKGRNDEVMGTLLSLYNVPSKQNMDAVQKSQQDIIQELDETREGGSRNRTVKSRTRIIAQRVIR